MILSYDYDYEHVVICIDDLAYSDFSPCVCVCVCVCVVNVKGDEELIVIYETVRELSLQACGCGLHTL
jgi:hypothetical protein